MGLNTVRWQRADMVLLLKSFLRFSLESRTNAVSPNCLVKVWGAEQHENSDRTRVHFPQTIAGLVDRLSAGLTKAL